MSRLGAALVLAALACRSSEPGVHRAASLSEAGANASARTAAAATDAPAASAVSSDAAPPYAVGAPPLASYTFQGRRLELESEGDACEVVYFGRGAVPQRLRLDLHPPCYLYVWEPPMPAPSQPDRGKGRGPVGAKGEPMAWRYDSLCDAAVLAVVGDPVPESLRQSDPLAGRGYHCGGAMQGIIIKDGDARPTRKRGPLRRCIEGGMDEKDFWILAHR